jgi:creatinine amidohydrolase
MEIRLENMSWPEVEELLKKPHVVILPTGSVEQHGMHLPLSVDYRCPTYVAELAARKVVAERDIRVVVAPAVHYGETSSTFGDFPGVIGLSIDTTMKVYEELARSFISNGFRNIIYLNGHGPNAALIPVALRKVSMDYPDIGLYGIRWLHLGFDVIPKIRQSEWGLHADEMETSASLVIQPENVHFDRAVKELPGFSLSSRWVQPDICGSRDKVLFHSREKFPVKSQGSSGVMGDPTVASKETGEKILEASANDLARIIVEIVESDSSRRT